MSHIGIPAGAAKAINDMLEKCARLQPGQEVLLLAHIDGLHGGDNMVDEQAISWIQTAVELYGAHATVLWINEPATPHAWRLPPVVKSAMQACDVLINNSFDIVMEENLEFRDFCFSLKNFVMVRNFATTAPLLCTDWAQTPYELVSEIRYQTLKNYQVGQPWQLEDNLGSQLEGIIDSPGNEQSWSAPYLLRREEAGPYRPWPEWVHTPIKIKNTSGIFIFNCMLSWWSRYIGIAPNFAEPIRLTINDNTIVKIEGGEEATVLKRFLDVMKERLGPRVFDFDHLHSGVHPNATVAHHQCPNVLYQRMIDHSHTSNIHFHIGGPPPTKDYPYWMHITGDTRTATFRIGGKLVHNKGLLTTLSDPAVLAMAAKYPGRPGVDNLAQNNYVDKISVK